jgi:hypothetical protein
VLRAVDRDDATLALHTDLRSKKRSIGFDSIDPATSDCFEPNVENRRAGRPIAP